MPRNLDIALEDMLTAIARIEEAADGVDFVRFSSDWRTRYIIERCLQIISEASRAIPDELKARHPDIKWVGVPDIGNVLRHQYASVSPSLIWNVVRDELPKLRAAIEAMRK
jgi:uncharacterized protein with HEPN domain